MIPVERHQQILALVAERGVVSITELTERLKVSHMTIRRDVQKLENKGALLSVSGGVQSLERLAIEPSHLDKTTMYSQQKERIGAMAARDIALNSSIYLDAGTTTLALARHLTDRDDLLVVTNDFVIANFLMESSRCQLVHTGGMVRRENRSCVGEATAQAIRNIFVDQAFISTSSWNLHGLYTPDENKVVVKRAIIQSSRQRTLLCDSSKYAKVATFMATPITVFSTIITDNGLPASAGESLVNMHISLLLAG